MELRKIVQELYEAPQVKVAVEDGYLSELKNPDAYANLQDKLRPYLQLIPSISSGRLGPSLQETLIPSIPGGRVIFSVERPYEHLRRAISLSVTFEHLEGVPEGDLDELRAILTSEGLVRKVEKK